jgi:hypothetical protein
LESQVLNLRLRSTYQVYFAGKFYLKTKTPAGK